MLAWHSRTFLGTDAKPRLRAAVGHSMLCQCQAARPTLTHMGQGVWVSHQTRPDREARWATSTARAMSFPPEGSLQPRLPA